MNRPELGRAEPWMIDEQVRLARLEPFDGLHEAGDLLLRSGTRTGVADALHAQLLRRDVETVFASEPLDERSHLWAQAGAAHVARNVADAGDPLLGQL